MLLLLSVPLCAPSAAVAAAATCLARLGLSHECVLVPLKLPALGLALGTDGQHIGHYDQPAQGQHRPDRTKRKAGRQAGKASVSKRGNISCLSAGGAGCYRE
jgi:hypothetical protein